MAHAQRVKKGIAQEVVSDSEYVFTTKGVTLNEDLVLELTQNIQSFFLASFLETDLSVDEKISQFVDHAKEQYPDQLKEKLKNYPTLKTKERSDFLDTLLESFAKEHSLGETDYQRKHLKDIIKQKSLIIWSVFNLATLPEMD